ncbi:cactin-like [Selaginella moellendorffii]|uniref:cactin-like n=1 Tax=Selaginella moellendorffii TaxID=88036 RepID=UPI000D1C5C4E|nr:cactin-like [Selaginella moellendorffii]|eukprot:XP_024525208.1 cactin-like [Selaginella moellendorffii]
MGRRYITEGATRASSHCDSGERRIMKRSRDSSVDDKKALRKVAKKMKAVSGYSNPFDLTELFVWRKKIKRDFAKKTLKVEVERQEERMKEAEMETEKWEERAMEKEEEEKARERENDREDECLYMRVTTTDLLSRLVGLRMAEPSHIFKGLGVKAMEELLGKFRLHLEANKKNTELWEAMTVVCDSELAEARKIEAGARGGVDHLVLDNAGLHTSNVNTSLINMSSRQLQEEQENIEEKLRSGSAKNVEFWKRVRVFKAKARLREIAMDLLAQQHHEISGEKVIEEAMPEPIPRQAVRGVSGASRGKH